MSVNKPSVFIIGGGASGIMAALSARFKGADVTILERNPRVGKKILATGNGRCNFTNVNTDVTCFSGENPDFVYGALSAFNVARTMGFFEKLGIVPKVEDMGKVFPMSDQASSILDVLLYELNHRGVKIVCNAFVKNIKRNKGKFIIVLEDSRSFTADRIILACGGKALPSSGSDGSGYELARGFGHTIVDIFPALVQVKLEGNFFKQIDGVKFVGSCEVISENKTIAKDKGDILFRNYGVSGPPVLQISRKAGELLKNKRDAILKISIIDTMSKKELDHLLMKRFRDMPEKTLDFSLVGLINKRLIRVVLKQAGIKDLNKPVAKVTEKERRKIAHILTDWRFNITGTMSWPNAQVTAGGVNTDEIDPFTMESVLVHGLYFSGEIMDIDGACGGFNLQWAWSSGYVAGENAAKEVKQ